MYIKNMSPVTDGGLKMEGIVKCGDLKSDGRPYTLIYSYSSVI